MPKRAEIYRERAEEMRTLADTMTDFTAKDTMLQMADKWDKMAEHVEKAGNPSPKAPE
jgi:hypothetical protein